MTITQVALASPLATLREGLALAMEQEEERFALLTQEHEDIKMRIMAALDALDAPTAATNGQANASRTQTNGAYGALAPPAPEVEPSDTEVDLSGMTMEQAALTVMGTRPGQVWRAKDLSPIFRAAGISDRVSSIAACLSIAFRNGKLKKAEPGEYILA